MPIQVAFALVSYPQLELVLSLEQHPSSVAQQLAFMPMP